MPKVPLYAMARYQLFRVDTRGFLASATYASHATPECACMSRVDVVTKSRESTPKPPVPEDRSQLCLCSRSIKSMGLTHGAGDPRPRLLGRGGDTGGGEPARTREVPGGHVSLGSRDPKRTLLVSGWDRMQDVRLHGPVLPCSGGAPFRFPALGRALKGRWQVGPPLHPLFRKTREGVSTRREKSRLGLLTTMSGACWERRACPTRAFDRLADRMSARESA